MQPNLLDEFFKNFGVKLSERRRLLGLSQAELAKEAGIHRTYVSDVENGKRNFSLATLFALSASLELSMTQLVAKAEPTTTPEQPQSLLEPEDEHSD